MPVELIVIGTSMGGLKAIETILTVLKADFNVPIALVQHRGAESTERLSMALRRYTALQVNDAQDKAPILPGELTLAPPDYHLMVEPGSYALSTEAPVHHARPSIDVLFQSAADAYGERVLAVVLTGASHDGADGVVRIKQQGGAVVVQTPSTAESPIMPQAAINAVRPDRVLLLEEVGPFLNTVNTLQYVSSESIECNLKRK